MSKVFVSIGAFCMLLCLGAGCTKYERTNPLDPKNQSSRRDLKPVVLSFVYNDGSGNPDSNYMKAYAAYEQIQSPSRLLSFEISGSDSQYHVNQFLRDKWDTTARDRVPLVYVGSSNNPMVGISNTQIHLDSIEARLASLFNKSSYWTMEGEARVVDRVFYLEIKIARLGSERSGSIRVLAFIAEPVTSTWSKVAYAFDEQLHAPFEASQVETITFSKELDSKYIPANKTYFALILNNENIMEQGAGFD